MVGEGVFGEVKFEVFEHVMAGAFALDPAGDFVFTAVGIFSPQGGEADGFEDFLGGNEKFLPGAMAFAGEGGVATDYEAFAREGGAIDSGEVALVEEFGLDVVGLDEFVDPGGAEGADPAVVGELRIGGGEVELLAGEHLSSVALAKEDAAIVDDDGFLDAECLTHAAELVGDGVGIGGVARVSSDGDRAAVAVG